MAVDTAPLPRVAIIGAGLTGLLLAQGLQKNGFPVTVYEKEAYLGEKIREWTMLLHWAWPVIYKILPEEVLADIHTAYTDPFHPYSDEVPETIPFFNAVTGQVAFRIPANARRISRTRLRRLCTRGLDVRWNKSVKDVLVPDEGCPITIKFDDGTTASSDLIIGADGPNSYIRRWLLGDEAAKPIPTPLASANGLVKYPTAEISQKVRAPHPICSIISAPNMVGITAIQEVPNTSDPSTWQFHTVAIWNDEPSLDTQYLTGDSAITRMKSVVNALWDFAEPFRSAINEVPSGSNFFLSRLHYWPTRPWDGKGGRKVTLAGDAAHALLPARGQGLNQAFKDVEVLLTEFIRVKKGELTAEEAVGVYEREVFERGPVAVQGSLDDAKDLMRVEGLEEGRTARKGFAQIGRKESS
ncbi:hypothetical protein QBC44DRAFT_368797 [Cladorrhinum sp. PSN332]|nr:hypothetical protein QBC44DRAFT_368797 [Cladorrhinum sp. PSN332]